MSSCICQVAKYNFAFVKVMLTVSDGASVTRDPQVSSYCVLFFVSFNFNVFMCSSQRRRAQSTSKVVEKMKKRLAEQVTRGIKILIYEWKHIPWHIENNTATSLVFFTLS